MTTKHDYKKAVRTLVHHQNWRTGADIEPLEPRQITKAIDVAVHALKVAQAVTQEPSLEMLDAGIESYDRNGMFALLSHFKDMRDKMLEGVE